MGKSSEDSQYVTINTITTGSTVVTGTYDEGTATTEAVVSSSSSTLSSGLADATIGGFTVTESSVEANGVTESGDDSDNTALIVGLAVGIPIFVGRDAMI